jgi:hypothetical protein
MERQLTHQRNRAHFALLVTTTSTLKRYPT